MLEKQILGYDARSLEEAKGIWTAREIAQQSRTIMATHSIINARKAEIVGFLNPLLGKSDLRIIFTGAGTSSFIGDSLASYFGARFKCSCQSISTTDIVSAPHLYLRADTPTLLVSFGRSGSSPESIRAVELANEIVSEIYHLVVTCNNEGDLAKLAQSNCFTLILPPETHDVSFAMTSSYTAMLYAAFACLNGIEKDSAQLIASSLLQTINEKAALAKSLFDKDLQRVIYLGSGVLTGAAHEASLKLLELTNGKIATMFETPLGFRHGPKTFVDDKTLIFVFISNNAYTRRYDIDLAKELIGDNACKNIIAISGQSIDSLSSENKIILENMADAEDIECLFPMIAIAQIFALEASLKMQITPDNPNPSGLVNRVVKGVIIHELSDA